MRISYNDGDVDADVDVDMGYERVYIWMGICTLGGACALMNRFCHASSSYHQTHVHLHIDTEASASISTAY